MKTKHGRTTMIFFLSRLGIVRNITGSSYGVSVAFSSSRFISKREVAFSSLFFSFPPLSFVFIALGHSGLLSLLEWTVYIGMVNKNKGRDRQGKAVNVDREGVSTRTGNIIPVASV